MEFKFTHTDFKPPYQRVPHGRGATPWDNSAFYKKLRQKFSHQISLSFS